MRRRAQSLDASHGEWDTYIDYPSSMQEGYGGLVLCALCYAGHVDSAEGAERALEVLAEILRLWQEAVVSGREQESRRRARSRTT